MGLLKYIKPKILLIDMPTPCTAALEGAGFNVKAGTFGRPWKVQTGRDRDVIWLEETVLPNKEEQEIIIVNLATPAPHERPPKFAGLSSGLVQCDIRDTVNPRPVAMYGSRPAFDKIGKHGGIFIALLAPKILTYYRGETGGGVEALDGWGFLSLLSEAVGSSSCQGQEIVYENNFVSDVLKRCEEQTTYLCSINTLFGRDDFFTLARNKYGEIVAGAILNKDKQQFLLMFPQIKNFHEIIVDVVGSICPIFNPSLFPDLKNAPWLHSPQYEIPKVIELQGQIDRIKAEADEKVNELQKQVDEIRVAEKDWYALLSGTGDDLVNAVINSLRKIGFKNVIKADEEAQAGGNGKREDIRIHDRSPILVLEVKGINNKPSDEDVMQAEKHARILSRELKGHDVQALTVINHQRHIPPHERDPQPYRKEMVDNARHACDGLMTTLDLFCLVRNKDRLCWPEQAVMDVFYGTGKIDPVPSHYVWIGEVVKVWPERQAFGLNPKVELHAGDRLSIELGEKFIELDALSLHVDKAEATVAAVDSNCSVHLDGAADLREGSRVFKVMGRDYIVSEGPNVT